MDQITIITPSYNSPDIYGTINSVLQQTYLNIQYILIDDASDSFDAEYIKEYISKHNRANIEVEILVNKENLGTVRSLNKALFYATGKYITVLAGDDCFYDKEVVGDIVQEFQETNAMVLTGYRCVCNYEMDKEIRLLPTKRERKKIIKLSPGDLFEEMVGYNFIFGCCTSYSRECFVKYGYYNEDYRIIEDYVINMLLLRNDVKIHFFDRVIVKYRSGGISACLNIGTEYFYESDAIFEHEIVPYSKNRWYARKKYSKWKRKVKTDREYLLEKQAANNRIRLCYIKLKYYLLHPTYFFMH